MNSAAPSRLGEILARNESVVLEAWLQQQAADGAQPASGQAARQAGELLHAVIAAVLAAPRADIESSAWEDVRRTLVDFSAASARKGYGPSQTAKYVFSLKHAIFELLRRELQSEPESLTAETWAASLLVDSLGLYTMEAFQKTREEVIARQQQELLELSTPVVELWENVIALPLIGTLDSGRTQVIMESLLQKIVETGSQVAIIDITGVPTVDTLVAQHLLKTVAAARLMGADCVLSGIRPQIAQTIVHLGVDLSGVITKASLADAFRVALRMTGAPLSMGKD